MLVLHSSCELSELQGSAYSNVWIIPYLVQLNNRVYKVVIHMYLSLQISCIWLRFTHKISMKKVLKKNSAIRDGEKRTETRC